MKAIRKLSIARKLAEKISPRLLDASVTDLGEYVWVVGRLPIEVSAAGSPGPLPIPIRIGITDNWDVVLPSVLIADRPAWLKCNADWHVFSHGQACYEFRQRWIDHFSLLIKSGEKDVYDYAAQWITRATSHLLQVHFICHKFQIKTWPEDVVPSWKHKPEDAQVQYDEEIGNRTRKKR